MTITDRHHANSQTITTDRLLVPDGSAVSPSIAYNSSLNTGFFRDPTGLLGVSINGTSRLTIGPAVNFNAARVHVNVGGVSNALDIRGGHAQSTLLCDTGSGIVRTAHIAPALTETYDIGTPDLKFRDINASLGVINTIRVGDGSAVAPSMAFTADTDCGFYYEPTQIITAIGGQAINIVSGTSNSLFRALNVSANSASTCLIRNGATHCLNVNTTAGSEKVETRQLQPLTDDTFTLGTSLLRWSGVHANLPSATTSDVVYFNSSTGALSQGAAPSVPSMGKLAGEYTVAQTNKIGDGTFTKLFTEDADISLIINNATNYNWTSTGNYVATAAQTVRASLTLGMDSLSSDNVSADLYIVKFTGSERYIFVNRINPWACKGNDDRIFMSGEATVSLDIDNQIRFYVFMAGSTKDAGYLVDSAFSIQQIA